MSTCSVSDCERRATRRGLCGKHYQRLCSRGTTDDPPRPSTQERFWSKVNKAGSVPEKRSELGPCWLWTGYLHRGYGQFHADQTTYRAHRFAYEEIVGPIPDGLEIDHLCRVRSCCNPSHLEPVTHRVNVLRSESFAAKYAAQTHCRRGHEFTPENTYVSPKNQRECRTCHREDERAFRAARRAREQGTSS